MWVLPVRLSPSGADAVSKEGLGLPAPAPGLWCDARVGMSSLVFFIFMNHFFTTRVCVLCT